jgi:uncharacterized protein (TIGR02996 family)
MIGVWGSTEEENAAFIRRILDDPADHTTRLVFADWLDEHSASARAEFVRLASALVRLPASAPERTLLTARYDALAQMHESDWLRPLRQFGGLWRLPWGEAFAEEAVLDATDFLAHYPAIYRLTPLRRVHLRDACPHIERLMRVPELRYLTRLQLSGRAEFNPYLATDDLGSRYSAPIDQPALAQLQRCEFFDRLTTLQLPHNQLSDFALSALLSGRWVRQLEHLDLGHNDLSDEGAHLLARVPFARLRVLEVPFNHLTAGGWSALANSQFLAGVQRLRIGPVPASTVPSAIRVRFQQRLQCY